MQFNSLEYLVLLLTTFVLFFNLPHRGRLLLLIGASLLFYAFWSVPLVSLIVISAVVDFTSGLMMRRCDHRWQRRCLVLLSAMVNLGLLGYFKYSNFFVENLHTLLGGAVERRFLDIVLPPGISFYTFQTMSYTLDVYRGKIQPTRSFLRFFLYVCFFPQLVAGPIERAGHLLTQFDYAASARASAINFVAGSRMIIWGMFKKVIFADYCARLVEQVYANPAAFDGWSALVATYAFTIQIYCDFSAYSEMARGSARLFGIDLIRNFDQPYLTTNISDFWRRWHISLSTWIRDYLFIPLGGSRHGKGRTLFNLFVVMFLSGLWHGAAWNFALWGLFHGVLLLATALLFRLPAFCALREKAGRLGALGGWFLNLHLVVFGWILFRVTSLGDFGIIVKQIGFSFLSLTAPGATQAGFFFLMGLFLLASYLARRYRFLDRIDRDVALSVVFYGLLVVIMLLFGRPDGPQFIYFQF